jgi:hypothetical protein
MLVTTPPATPAVLRWMHGDGGVEKPVTACDHVSGALGLLGREDALPNRATSPGTGQYDIFGYRPIEPPASLGLSKSLWSLVRPTVHLKFEF